MVLGPLLPEDHAPIRPNTMTLGVFELVAGLTRLQAACMGWAVIHCQQQSGLPLPACTPLWEHPLPVSRRHPVLQEVDVLHGVVEQGLEDAASHSAVADSEGDAFEAMITRVEASSSVPDRQAAVSSAPAVVSSRLELVQPWESEPPASHTSVGAGN